MSSGLQCTATHYKSCKADIIKTYIFIGTIYIDDIRPGEGGKADYRVGQVVVHLS